MRGIYSGSVCADRSSLFHFALFQGVKVTVRVRKGQTKGACQVRECWFAVCACAYVSFVCLHVRLLAHEPPHLYIQWQLLAEWRCAPHVSHKIRLQSCDVCACHVALSVCYCIRCACRLSALSMT